jgi:hypothetical protein
MKITSKVANAKTTRILLISRLFKASYESCSFVSRGIIDFSLNLARHNHRDDGYNTLFSKGFRILLNPEADLRTANQDFILLCSVEMKCFILF